MILKPYIKGLLLTILSLSLSTQPAMSQQLQAALSHYSADDGMTSDAIADLKRDGYGFIWIATWNGLSRFDGYHFYNYQTGNASGIPFLHNRIFSMTIDQAQNVWLRMYDGRIYVLNRLTDTIINPLEGVEGYENMMTNHDVLATTHGEVLAIIEGEGIYVMKLDGKGVSKRLIAAGALHVNTVAEGRQGDLWAGTDKGLRRISLSDYTLSGKGIFEGENIQSMASDGYTIYAGTSNGKLLSYAPGQEPKTLAELNDRFTGMYVDSQHNIWFSQLAQGISKMNPATGTVRHYTQHTLMQQYDSHGAIMQEVNGTIWAAMNHGGFGYYNAETDDIAFFHNDPSNSWNLSNNINAFLALDEGVVFESTSRRGLEKLEILKRTIRRAMLFEGENTSANEIRALYYDEERRQLLIGNKLSSLIIMKDGQRTEIKGDDKGNAFGRIYGISKDRGGSYWISTKGGGVFSMSRRGSGYVFNRYCHRADDPNSLNDDRAYCSLEDREGNIWVATYGGGVNILVRQPDGSFRIAHKDNLLKNYPKAAYQKVRTLAMDNKGNIWAGTTDGILIMSCHNRKVAVSPLKNTSNPKNQIGSNDVVCIATAPDGSMWVGTNGGGLCHTTGKDEKGFWRFENFHAQDGLPSEEIRSIAFDRQGYLWLATDHVLCSYDIRKKIFSAFSIQDGVDDTMCSEGSALSLPDGNVLFGTLNGYYVVDRKKLTSTAGSQLKLRITDFMLEGKIVSPRNDPTFSHYVPNSQSVELPGHDTQFSVRFASLNYQLQHRVHYQYMLEGYDSDWQNADKTRTATYADLPTGNYTFRVKAFLLESPENYDMRTLDIKVPPYWFLSTTAVWIYIILLGAAILAAIFMVQEKAKAQQRGHVLRIGDRDVIIDSTEDYEFMKKQMAWLETHYSDTEMTHDDLAAQSSFARTEYFNKLKTYTGMTPKEFMTKYRLKKAIQLFDEDSSLSLKEIATGAGFSDMIYFMRTFKEATGMSPSNYREQKLAEQKQAER